MKSILAASLVSAVVASVATWLLTTGGPRPPEGPAAPSITASDFKEALGDLEREVAALRREAAERAGRTSAMLPPAPPAPREDGAPTAHLPEATSGTPPTAVRRPDAGVAAALAPPLEPTPEVVARLQEVSQWFQRPEVRARWLLLPEEKVLEQFGLPDSIGANQVQENWVYTVPTGETGPNGWPAVKRYTLILNRGRLVQSMLPR